VAILVCSAPAQERYLIAPNAEVIPLSPRESAAEVMKVRRTRNAASAATCPDKFTFGYTPEIYTANSNFGAFHRDVLGEWFVAPASGTIDTIFWYNREHIGAYDSTVYVRVHASNIGPQYGPGVRPGPFSPPCQNWGYWRNSNDLDQGVAAFLEDATDTAWVSTINAASQPSMPPIGAEIWGLGGYAVRIHPNSVGHAAMEDLAMPIVVTAGDKFFVSMRVGHEPDSLGGHKEEGTQEDRTEWNASGFAGSIIDPEYPSHNWKFYEHDKGPSNCSGFPIDSIRKGWVARGGYADDTLSVAAYNFWYVMTVVSNTPPVISEYDPWIIALCCYPPSIDALIEDCDAENPSRAGVDSAFVVYTLGGERQPEIAMTNIGGSAWEGLLPAFQTDTTIEYRIRAVDKAGAVSYSRMTPYRVVRLGNAWYDVDTADAGVTHDIHETGTAIALGAFFGPPGAPQDFDPLDAGTAGPFDLGGPFVAFGDTFRYAWIGVDGAMALSRRLADTLDVSAKGLYAPAWDFPYATAVDRGRAADGMPRMTLAPFYNDLRLPAAGSAGSGAIRFGAGDSCTFVAEWDSLGGVAGGNSFRVVLDRCDESVTYEYAGMGDGGMDSTALIGMQNDPASAQLSGSYLFLNRHFSPAQTTARSNWRVRMTPRTALGVAEAPPLPAAYELAQNYPNPFNPVTTIRYALPVASAVRLGVFNLLGQEVASLVRAVEGPGMKSVQFDARNLPSGVYVYRLQAGAFTDAKKLLILK
jgi:hypothetical protein